MPYFCTLLGESLQQAFCFGDSMKSKSGDLFFVSKAFRYLRRAVTIFVTDTRCFGHVLRLERTLLRKLRLFTLEKSQRHPRHLEFIYSKSNVHFT